MQQQSCADVRTDRTDAGFLPDISGFSGQKAIA